MLDYIIKDTIYDCLDDDLLGAIGAILDNKVIGTIDFRLSNKEKEFYILMIKVDEDYRRQGIATAMLNYARKKYSDYYVEWGYVTEDGAYLKDKLTKTIVNQEYVELERELDNIKKKLNSVESEMDTLYDSGDTENERITELGDKWDELYQRQNEIDKELDCMTREIVVWR